MSEKTEIAWTDASWNPWIGCTKVSPGCRFCYAENSPPAKFGGIKWGDDGERKISSDATFDAPLKWNKRPWVCDLCGHATDKADLSNCPNCDGDLTGFHRRRVFSLSLGDWLDPKVPVAWLVRMLDIIRRCPDLDFLLCTKRPELWSERIAAARGSLTKIRSSDDLATSFWCQVWLGAQNQSGPLVALPPQNIWIIASAEDQPRYDERRPHLEAIPAVVHGWSLEPLLGPIRLHSEDKANWAIIGGESGKNARPCEPQWIRSIVEQCKSASTAVFVKQLGANVFWNPSADAPSKYADRIAAFEIKHPKGGNMEEWPNDLRIRQFPNVTHA